MLSHLQQASGNNTEGNTEKRFLIELAKLVRKVAYKDEVNMVETAAESVLCNT